MKVRAYIDTRYDKPLKPVYLVVTHNYKRKRISTSLRCYEKDWLDGDLKPNHPDRKTLHALMDDAVGRKAGNNRHLSASLPDLVGQYIKEASHLEEETLRTYVYLEKNLNDYEDKSGFKTVEQLDFDYFMGYFHFLSGIPYQNSSIKLQFQKISSVLGWFELNIPTYHKKIFSTIKNKKGTVKKYLLTESQADAIYQHQGTDRQRLAQDMFVFCYETGLRVSELQGLKPESLSTLTLLEEGSRKINVIDVEYKKHGATKSGTIYLNDRAYEIFTRNNKNLNLIWPAEANILIKEVCAEIGGNFLNYVEEIRYCGVNEVRENKRVYETISMHTARHSFINKLKRQGLDNEAIADLVNHASVRTTEKSYLQKDRMKSILKQAAL